jgi:nucleoside-diphosphate-sugar epimerase
MRVVVLGGTRFIGRAIVQELMRAGQRLLVVHRGRSPGVPGVPALHAERARLREVRRELVAFGPEAVVDTYAMTRADAEAGVAALDGELLRVVLSSMDVYRAYTGLHTGRLTDALPLDEASPVRPERYPYRGVRLPGLDELDLDAYEKLDVEDVYGAAGATVCRLPFVFGERDPQRREEFILRRVRAGRARIPMGPGTWLGSRGYVADVARGVRLALETDAAQGELLNLCEERTWPIGVWARQILDAAGSAAQLVPVPESVLPEDMPERGLRQHLLVSSAKACALLGWRQTDPVEGVRRSVRWHLAHPPEREDPDFAADDRALEQAG